jgi:hypothetical protein
VVSPASSDTYTTCACGISRSGRRTSPRGWSAFPAKQVLTRGQLREAFKASGAAIETFLSELLAGAPKRRPFKKGIATTLAYFVAPESLHRGAILLTLKASGETLDRQASYAIWGWDQM